MTNLFKNVGVDKFAHLGIGGLICAVISTVLIFQDGMISWAGVLYGIAASVFVFGISVFKEYFMDDKFEWADIIYAMFGCALYLIALCFGIGLYLMSH